MAFTHFAYSFDSVTFHKQLQTTLIHESKLNLSKLQDLAKSIVSNASDDLKQVLSNINYNNEWLDDPDGDKSQAYLWYTVCLVNTFHTIPSLSNRGMSHFILEKVLPIVGWGEKEVIELILGDHLDKFLVNSEYQFLAKELSIYGGVVNRRRLPLILSHLRDSEDHFSSPTPETYKVMEEFAKYSNLSIPMLLHMSFEDAEEMLETAISRNEDLYLYRN